MNPERKPVFRKTGMRSGIWSAVLTAVAVVSVIAQDLGVALVDGGLIAGGGSATGGSVRVYGQLGAPFETVDLAGGDFRVYPGFLVLRGITVKTGDFDGDGETGFQDFLVFAAAFGTLTGDEGFLRAADLDRSGDVGFSDFLLFAAAFGM